MILYVNPQVEEGFKIKYLTTMGHLTFFLVI